METKTMNHTEQDIQKMIERHHFSDETKRIIEKENLLPLGLIERLHKSYPQYSGFYRTKPTLFNDKHHYIGLKGFREILEILSKNGITLNAIEEREFFIRVYRFMATKHVLNAIDWDNYEKDNIYQLVLPQPGMIRKEEVDKYLAAKTEEEKQAVVDAYIEKTNPHDGKQKLNKPWFINDDGELEIIEGCQHKYPPIMLILDQSTQNCFAFCTYCFRHAQVRGDEDMFVQKDIQQIHRYIRQHKEVTDILITGGDAGYITYERFKAYVEPILTDPEMIHIKTVRLGSRALTFYPELILTDKFTPYLELAKKAIDTGVQVAWVSHFSTPREVLNPATIAAIRRLKSYGILVKSQSPIMNHISLFTDENGKVDIDRSAQNWIDLGNILSMVGIGFHSMYCARPTGEHHYFTAPLADITQIFDKVYKTLASFSRPSRYITMTSSAGKISLMGVAEIKGEKVFVLKFNEGRNMDWIHKVYFGKYDEKEHTIANLKPYEGDKHFYEDELEEIENRLEKALKREIEKNKHQ